MAKNIICRVCGEKAHTYSDRGLFGRAKTMFAVCRTSGCKNENFHAKIDEDDVNFIIRYEEV